ncbi:MAG: MBL fold metallo-hydrolase [Oscillospiraceae bacterium]|nr:MBL fold metallo-hydrolase [Oscillospiraceae bacterium]
MKLTWLGTAALLLQTDDTTVAVDPFPGLPLHEPIDREIPDRAMFERTDHVLVTHGHFDHIMFIPALYGEGNCPVYATQTPCRTLESKGFPTGRLHRIAPGDEFDLGDLQIRTWQGRHCHFDLPLVARTLGSPRSLTHLTRLAKLLRLNREYDEAGEILFYEVTDGKTRLQIMGSLGLDDATEYPTGADWLILPYQGRSDLADYALPLVERLSPRAVLLDHYDDAFPPMSSAIDTATFEKTVSQRLGIPCRALQKYETVDL